MFCLESWFLSEPKYISVPRPSLESWWLVGTSSTLRLGVEWRRQALYGGCGDPLPWWRSSLVEPGAKVTVIKFTEETWWMRNNTLCECFNNMDVGVTLWLTEPRNKSSCHKLIPPLSFHIYLLQSCVALLS